MDGATAGRSATSPASSSPTTSRPGRTRRSTRSSPTAWPARSSRPRQAAGDKVVGLHGASVMQQALPLGLVDEIRVHVIPVLLGGGTPLFATLDSAISLERTRGGDPGRDAPGIPRGAVVASDVDARRSPGATTFVRTLDQSRVRVNARRPCFPPPQGQGRRRARRLGAGAAERAAPLWTTASGGVVQAPRVGHSADWLACPSRANGALRTCFERAVLNRRLACMSGREGNDPGARRSLGCGQRRRSKRMGPYSRPVHCPQRLFPIPDRSRRGDERRAVREPDALLPTS